MERAELDANFIQCLSYYIHNNVNSHFTTLAEMGVTIDYDNEFGHTFINSWSLEVPPQPTIEELLILDLNLVNEYWKVVAVLPGQIIYPPLITTDEAAELIEIGSCQSGGFVSINGVPHILVGNVWKKILTEI